MSLPTKSPVAHALGPDGPFSVALTAFEWRLGQQEMAVAVEHAVQKGGVALIEAGTGTGKSLAYLVPSALYALESGEKVVISTNTITLQEQLINKDIPLIQSVLAPDLRACLVKGWRNYICLLRLESAAQDNLADVQDITQYQDLLRWAAESREGTLAELGREPAVWDEVCAESDTCLRADCPLQQKCFFMRARAQMQDAHLLVVNHHLLFADVAVRRSVGWDTERAVLPRYQTCILDEAHHVEHVASDFLSAALSDYALQRLLKRLYQPTRNAKSRGVLSLVSAKASAGILQGNHSDAGESVLNILENQAFPNIDRMSVAGKQLFAAVTAWMGNRQNAVARIRTGSERNQWYEYVKGPAEALAEASAELAALLRKLKTTAAPLLSEDPGVLRELDALAQRCTGWSDLTTQIGSAEDEETVFWVDSAGRGGQVRALATPLEVGPAVREWVENLHTLVCTSATLSVAGDFSYIKSRMGLTDSETESELIIPSPFSYKEQALVGIVNNLPEPTAKTYPEALVTALHELIRASRGRAFLLFTSYALLKYVAQQLAPLCKKEEWPLLVQGQANRSQMLSTFRTENSVLLGTDSFWEGVDVPGDALSCVVLTRLPFRVPDDPVTEARTEAMKRQGLDPFYGFSLPEAVLKFKQGFGRLIRTRTDRGVVIVCDRRIMERSYGRYFFSSLPECSSVAGAVQKVADTVRDWV